MLGKSSVGRKSTARIPAPAPRQRVKKCEMMRLMAVYELQAACQPLAGRLCAGQLWTVRLAYGSGAANWPLPVNSARITFLPRAVHVLTVNRQTASPLAFV